MAQAVKRGNLTKASASNNKNSLSAANSKNLLQQAFTQTFNVTVDTCALIWQSIPPDPLPNWLKTPESGNLLASDEPFYYLAGRLIANGVVDATSCPSGGLQGDGYANECGLQIAQPQVYVWQDQFDPEIMNVATALGVPAQMMKNLFAQESQFWPGEFRYAYEYGLGQITDQGVDVLFMWNPVFYQAFCPLVLSRDTCAPGYMKLSFENRALLRGTTVYKTQNCHATRYMHHIAEIDAADAVTGTIEPDTLILCRVFRDATNDTCSDEVFLLLSDCHYQADRAGTKNKAPDFYA